MTDEYKLDEFDQKIAQTEVVLNAMEVVEKRLEREKSDASISIATLLMVISAWSVICQLWELLGRPIAPKTMTVGVELIGVLMLIFLVKKTRFQLKDMGLNFNNMGRVMLRGGIIALVCVAVMLAAKLVILRVSPDYFGDKPFFNYSTISITYILTAVLQEFLSRGVTQECLSRIFTGKHSAAISIAITCFFFAGLHMFYGFLFMLGAGVLSLILGIIYQKDHNIWGVALIHCIFGWFGVAFGLVG